MFRRGRRLFTTASICLILTGLAHLTGHLSAPPQDDATRNLMNAMQSYRFDLGMGMSPSTWDVFRSLSLLMAVTLPLLGLQNLLVARYDDSGRLVRLLTFLNLIGIGALVVIFWIYWIPPPLISLGVVEALFLLAAVVPDPA